MMLVYKWNLWHFVKSKLFKQFGGSLVIGNAILCLKSWLLLAVVYEYVCISECDGGLPFTQVYALKKMRDFQVGSEKAKSGSEMAKLGSEMAKLGS